MTKLDFLYEDIVKGRDYNVWVDFPMYWQYYHFTAYLRVGSKFFEMDMDRVYPDDYSDILCYKISLSDANQLDIKNLSGPCEIQIAMLDPTGYPTDVLVMETKIVSNKPIIGGGNNG